MDPDQDLIEKMVDRWRKEQGVSPPAPVAPRGFTTPGQALSSILSTPRVPLDRPGVRDKDLDLRDGFNRAKIMTASDLAAIRRAEKEAKAAEVRAEREAYRAKRDAAREARLAAAAAKEAEKRAKKAAIRDKERAEKAALKAERERKAAEKEAERQRKREEQERREREWAEAARVAAEERKRKEDEGGADVAGGLDEVDGVDQDDVGAPLTKDPGDSDPPDDYDDSDDRPPPKSAKGKRYGKSAYEMLEDMRYVYAKVDGRKKLLKMVHKDDKQFAFLVRELIKIESAMKQAEIRKGTDDVSIQNQQNFFVVLKGLEDAPRAADNKVIDVERVLNPELPPAYTEEEGDVLVGRQAPEQLIGRTREDGG